MSKISRQQRGKLLKRDDRKCGIHLGGCGEPIEFRSQCSGDHIVPQVLFEAIAPKPTEFDDNWNHQPMHKECNLTKSDRLQGRILTDLEAATTIGANTPEDWPRFECKCHYLQIIEGGMYVCTKKPISPGQHLLYPNVVKDIGNEDRQDAILVLGRTTGPKGTPMVGYSALNKNTTGFLLPSFSPKRVQGFNIMEARRVELPGPDKIYIDERGYVTPVI